MSKRTHTEMSGSPLPSNMIHLLETGDWSDFIIKTKTKEFKVHKAFVLSRSEPLTAIMRNGKEASTDVLDLTNYDPVIVELMIRFLYSGTLDIPDFLKLDSDPDKEENSGSSTSKHKKSAKSTETRENTPAINAGQSKDDPSHPSINDVHAKGLILFTELYALADQWQIILLKQAAAEAYRKYLPLGWNGAEFTASLKLVFDNTMEKDKPLRNAAVGTAGKHADELLDRQEFTELLKNNAEICFGVMNAAVQWRRDLPVRPPPSETGCPWFGQSHRDFIGPSQKPGYAVCKLCSKRFLPF